MKEARGLSALPISSGGASICEVDRGRDLSLSMRNRREKQNNEFVSRNVIIIFKVASETVCNFHRNRKNKIGMTIGSVGGKIFLKIIFDIKNFLNDNKNNHADVHFFKCTKN